MSSLRIPGWFSLFVDNHKNDIDEGTLCRSRSSVPGTVGSISNKTDHSYSISGTTGALGQMLFTEAMRIPGIWYDRTEQTTALRAKEAALGETEFADKAFQNSAKMTKRNIRSPSKVDVDIHFETKDRVENITVRGRRGTRSFRFDFDALEANQQKLPKGADPLKPFFDTIKQILAAVIQVR